MSTTLQAKLSSSERADLVWLARLLFDEGQKIGNDAYTSRCQALLGFLGERYGIEIKSGLYALDLSAAEDKYADALIAHRARIAAARMPQAVVKTTGFQNRKL